MVVDFITDVCGNYFSLQQINFFKSVKRSQQYCKSKSSQLSGTRGGNERMHRLDRGMEL